MLPGLEGSHFKYQSNLQTVCPIGSGNAGAYPRVLGFRQGNTIESRQMGTLCKYIKLIIAEFIVLETDCSCLQSCNIPRLWLNICQYPHSCTLPGKHYVALLKNFPIRVRKMFSFSQTIWNCAAKPLYSFNHTKYVHSHEQSISSLA